MPEQKTPAALTANLAAIGTLVTGYCTVFEPTTAVLFALLTFVVAQKV